MITVNGQKINSIPDFSLRFQDLVLLIDGAQTWLAWAMSGPAMINVSSEKQLFGLIQMGLHNDAYIRFNTFRATTEKICTLSDADIRQLSFITARGNNDDVTLAPILQRNNIITYQQIGEASQSLASAGLAGNALFSAMSFRDWLDLATYYSSPALDAGQQTNAYNFALNRATTVEEFVQLASMYKWLVQNSNSGINSVDGAQNVYNKLLPLTYFTLFAPNIGADMSEQVLSSGLSSIANNNSFIGYNSCAAAVANLAMNININNAGNWQDMITGYLAAVKNVVASTTASSYNLLQDGSEAVVGYNTSNGTVSIGVDATGAVFIKPESKLNY